jgi:hypothetical protein
MTVQPQIAGVDALREALQSPALQAIADHWHHVCGARRMPAWSDISPSAIAPYLSRIWAFKYNRHSGEFTARLGGNRSMVGFGASFRGTPLADLHSPPIFREVHCHLTRAVLAPAAFRCSGMLFKVGDFIVHGERVILPLASKEGEADGIFGASDYEYPAATGPVQVIHDNVQWFDI